MGERAPYSRVYWSVVDDPKFATIFDDDHHLATWLRLLISADAIWPASPSMPRSARQSSVKALAAAGLLDLVPGHRYRIHGLDAERGRRKDSASMARDEALTGADRTRQWRLRSEVFERDGFACRYCGKSDERRLLVMDHLTPKIAGGPDELWNLVTACRSCNSKKGGRTPEQAGMVVLPVTQRDAPRDGDGDGDKAPSRARDAMLVSSIDSSRSTVEGGPGGDDPAVAFNLRTGEYPSAKMLSWLDELGEAHGEARVAKAINLTVMTGRDPVAYLKAVRDRLRAEDRDAERREVDDERKRLRDKRAPVVSDATAKLRAALVEREGARA